VNPNITRDIKVYAPFSSCFATDCKSFPVQLIAINHCLWCAMALLALQCTCGATATPWPSHNLSTGMPVLAAIFWMLIIGCCTNCLLLQEPHIQPNPSYKPLSLQMGSHSSACTHTPTHTESQSNFQVEHSRVSTQFTTKPPAHDPRPQSTACQPNPNHEPTPHHRCYNCLRLPYLSLLPPPMPPPLCRQPCSCCRLCLSSPPLRPWGHLQN
jgi:hypothetical protein